MGGMGNIIINVNTFTHLLNKSKDWFIERQYIYSTFSKQTFPPRLTNIKSDYQNHKKNLPHKFDYIKLG